MKRNKKSNSNSEKASVQAVTPQNKQSVLKEFEEPEYYDEF